MAFSHLAGNMLHNPVDYSQDMMGADHLGSLGKAIEILTDWDEVDLCIGYLRPSQLPPDAWGTEMMRWGGTMANAYARSHKPVAFICETAILPEPHKITYHTWQQIVNHKIPLYYTYAGAVEALRLVFEYNEREQRRRLLD